MSTNRHTAFDAQGFRRLVVSGAECLEANADAINALNVSPVPDGDTGRDAASGAMSSGMGGPDGAAAPPGGGSLGSGASGVLSAAQADPASSGRVLTEAEREIFEPHFPAAILDSARIFDGWVPWWLSEKMIAVVRGHKIYIRKGEYVPGTARGVEVLGHELVHVEQYANGLNVARYAWANRKGYSENKYEKEAYAKDDIVREDFCSKNTGAPGCGN